MIYLTITSIIVSFVALYHSYQAKSDSDYTMKQLHKYCERDLKSHKTINEALDLIYKWMEKGGVER